MMGSRYFMTGVQLGIIEAFIEKEPKQALDLLKEIEDKQYIGNTEYFDSLFNNRQQNGQAGVSHSNPLENTHTAPADIKTGCNKTLSRGLDFEYCGLIKEKRILLCNKCKPNEENWNEKWFDIKDLTHLMNPTLDVVSRIDGEKCHEKQKEHSIHGESGICDNISIHDISNSKEQKICESNKDCHNCELKDCGCRE